MSHINLLLAPLLECALKDNAESVILFILGQLLQDYHEGDDSALVEHDQFMVTLETTHPEIAAKHWATSPYLPTNP